MRVASCDALVIPRCCILYLRTISVQGHVQLCAQYVIRHKNISLLPSTDMGIISTIVATAKCSLSFCLTTRRYLAKWAEVADDDRAAEAFTGIFPKGPAGPGGEVTYLVLNVGTCQQFVDLYGEGNAYHLIEESRGVKFADQKVRG